MSSKRGEVVEVYSITMKYVPNGRCHHNLGEISVDPPTGLELLRTYRNGRVPNDALRKKLFINGPSRGRAGRIEKVIFGLRDGRLYTLSYGEYVERNRPRTFTLQPEELMRVHFNYR
jgi:hypothetical protein